MRDDSQEAEAAGRGFELGRVGDHLDGAVGVDIFNCDHLVRNGLVSTAGAVADGGINTADGDPEGAERS